MLTFSWRRCFRSFSSRYVRLERTGVLKGFMIFLMATAWLVSWSLAELPRNQYVVGLLRRRRRTKRGQRRPCPLAANRCTYAMLVAPGGGWWGVAAPAGNLERRAKNLGAHEFSHGEVWVGGDCDGRKWEQIRGTSGVVVV